MGKTSYATDIVVSCGMLDLKLNGVDYDEINITKLMYLVKGHHLLSFFSVLLRIQSFKE